jgi:hypothetical protein
VTLVGIKFSVAGGRSSGPSINLPTCTDLKLRQHPLSTALVGWVQSSSLSGPIVTKNGSFEPPFSMATPNLPKKSGPSTSSPVPYLYEFRCLCSPYTRQHWFYPSIEVHFDREKDRHLESGISVNIEARIRNQAAHCQPHQQTSQRSIEGYFRHNPTISHAFCSELWILLAAY